jgi:Pyruvate/2-oxoacid:ferredoxin oxidoreductase gamma subunit
MAARGFQGPEAQRLYMTQVSKLSIFTNTIALGLLAGLIVFVTKLKY